ncbi:MAG TPA: flagellar protein FlgN [Opitutus sp.]|nr:flagellar protein FlgN [Opitutus sp.]
MNPTWQNLADKLRTELAEHGALLQLYNEQQECLFRRDANGVLHFTNLIEQQVEHLQVLRRDREENTAAFALQHERPADSTLRSLLPCIEANARPLLEALIGEVNHLIHRVRRASRHNHHLLARTVELQRETLRSLRPSEMPDTYAATGRLAFGGSVSGNFCTAR